LKTVATSTIKTSLRSIAISPMPQPLSEDTWEIRVIQAERMDLSSLHQIAQDVNFSDIVNAAILVIQIYAFFYLREKEYFFQFSQRQHFTSGILAEKARSRLILFFIVSNRCKNGASTKT
jgi:hypothetical protein